MRLSIVVALCLSIANAFAQGNATPNIIVLFADDMGYADINCWGHPTIKTPNLNRMASQGMKFMQWYSGAPICSPSRGSILTGRLPVRNGIVCGCDYPEDILFRVFLPWSTGGLQDTEITLPEALKSKGYTSAIIGKWHLGHYNNTLPTQNGGFDYFYGLPYSQDEGCPYHMHCSDWEEMFPGVPLYRNEQIIQQPVNLETLMERYNEEALSFIETSANKSTPFFLYMAYDEVHVPLFASPNFLNTSLRGLFGDAVQEMDNSIGLILKKLQTLGIDQNTLVFFTSDNGPWIEQGLNGGSAGLFRGGKGSTWEGGMREPAIAWWPGKISPGTVNFDIGSTMDIFVTALEVAGVTPPNDRVIDDSDHRDSIGDFNDLCAVAYDSVSLTQALFETGPIPRDVYFLYRDHVLYAVRYQSYKAHFYTRDGFTYDPPTPHDPPLLFNIDQDPSEAYPLDTTQPQYQAILQIINQEVEKHKQNLVPGIPQLEPIDPEVGPCCNDSDCICGPW